MLWAVLQNQIKYPNNWVIWKDRIREWHQNYYSNLIWLKSRTAYFFLLINSKLSLCEDVWVALNNSITDLKQFNWLNHHLDISTWRQLTVPNSTKLGRMEADSIVKNIVKEISLLFHIANILRAPKFFFNPYGYPEIEGLFLRILPLSFGFVFWATYLQIYMY